MRRVARENLNLVEKELKWSHQEQRGRGGDEASRRKGRRRSDREDLRYVRKMQKKGDSEKVEEEKRKDARKERI